MYISASISTIIAWFVGMILDANIGFEPVGFLELRILLPILTMGLFIIKSINKKYSK